MRLRNQITSIAPNAPAAMTKTAVKHEGLPRPTETYHVDIRILNEPVRIAVIGVGNVGAT